MNLKEIKEIINLMNENELTEIELERDGLKIKLKKRSGQIEQMVTSIQQVSSQEAVSANMQPASKTEELIEIKSPMVGTFYRASSPESMPFIDVGSEVQPEKVVCIIEAMKLMNEIKSEIRGIVKEILVENGRPVEFGQVLFRVHPVGEGL